MTGCGEREGLAVVKSIMTVGGGMMIILTTIAEDKFFLAVGACYVHEPQGTCPRFAQLNSRVG